MRLATSTLVSVALPLMCFGGMLWLLINSMLGSRFDSLEHEQATSVANRLASLVDDELNDLTTICRDYAWWTAAAEFANTSAAETQTRDTFIADTLTPTTMGGIGVHALRITSASGATTFASGYHQPDEDWHWTEVPAALAQDVSAWEAAARNDGSITNTIIALDDDAWLISIHPLRASDGEPPNLGSLLMARPVAEQVRATLSDGLGHGVSLVNRHTVVANVTRQLGHGASLGFAAESSEMTISVPLSGTDLWLQTQLTRTFAQHAALISKLILGVVVLVVLMTIAVLWGLLHITIVNRLRRLGKGLGESAKNGNQTSFRARAGGKDEIAELGSAIDRAFAATEQALAEANSAQAEADRSADQTWATLAHLSHEIRTPLHGIMGMARSLIEREGQHAADRESSRTIMDCAANLTNLLDDALDMARIDAGGFSVQAQPHLIGNLLRQAAVTFQATAAREGIYLRLAIDPATPPRVMVDAQRMHQILLNLIGNALKFTRRGGITISCRPVDPLAVEIDVSDTGIGMSQAETEQVFDRYAQGNSIIGNRFGGSGLGLALSRHLLEAMAGSISVTSQPGDGTTMRITIPATARDARDSNVMSEPQHPPLVWTQRSIGKAVSEAYAGLVVSEAENWVKQLQANPQVAVVLDLIAGGDEVLAISNHLLIDRPCVVLAPGQPVEHWLEPRLNHNVQVLPGNADTATIGQALCVTEHQQSMPTQTRLAAGQRVLVADDAVVNREIASATLRRFGLEPLVAADGEEAVLLWRVERPDLILMDIRMPGISGLDACRRIRDEERNGRTPILALTADSDPGQAALCSEAGMDGVITKPIDDVDLITCLRRHLATRSNDEIATTNPGPEDTSANPLGEAIETRLHTLIADLDQDGAEAVIGFFLEEQAETRERLQLAITNLNAPQAADAAHRLQGIAANVGLIALARCAARLEAALTEGDDGTTWLGEELDHVAEQEIKILRQLASNYGLELTPSSD